MSVKCNNLRYILTWFLNDKVHCYTEMFNFIYSLKLFSFQEDILDCGVMRHADKNALSRKALHKNQPICQWWQALCHRFVNLPKPEKTIREEWI